MNLNCIHQDSGLCPSCQEDYDADPIAWLKYGDHVQGIANWQALQAEMAAEASRHPAGCSCGSPDCPHNPFRQQADDSLPF